MIRVISWNINNQIDPWHWLARMKERGEADLALLQETGIPPLPPRLQIGFDTRMKTRMKSRNRRC